MIRLVANTLKWHISMPRWIRELEGTHEADRIARPRPYACWDQFTPDSYITTRLPQRERLSTDLAMSETTFADTASSTNRTAGNGTAPGKRGRNSRLSRRRSGSWHF